ncbi:MAG: UPF0164 family protein [Spirochaetales bacterium]|nr:UPF0164 family protein [Spirochaetales bacterium]
MRSATLFLVFFLSFCGFLHADYSDFYSQWASFFYPNQDPNSGLTIFPTLFIPMGGKYEGMGTAFTAVSDDLSFIESNPAGSSQLEKTELGFLHHSWIMDSNIEAVAFAIRIGDLGLAASGKFLYVPFNEKDEWGHAGGSGYYIESIITANISYNFFKSYYFGGISLGANIKAAYMGVPASIYPDQSLITAMVDVGILTRFNFLYFGKSVENNFALGATFKNYSPFATGDPLPTLATFGISYAPIRPLLFAFDFNLPISLDPSIPAERYYFAGGLCITFSPSVVVEAGVKFKGGNPMVTVGSTIDLATVSFAVNYNLDLSNTMNPLDKFSLSAKFNLGDSGRQDKRVMADELYLQGVKLYANDKLEEAIAVWEKVLEIDPGYTPARDNIAIAKRKLELQKEIKDRQIYD